MQSIELDIELPITVELETSRSFRTDGSLGPNQTMCVASCPGLDYTSPGATEQGARDMMLEVFRFNVQEHRQKGTLDQYLAKIRAATQEQSI